MTTNEWKTNKWGSYPQGAIFNLNSSAVMRATLAHRKQQRLLTTMIRTGSMSIKDDLGVSFVADQMLSNATVEDIETVLEQVTTEEIANFIQLMAMIMAGK